MPPVNEEFNEEIRTICEASPCSCGTILKFKASARHLYDYIMGFSKHLEDLPFTARIWFALTGRREYEKCAKCGKDIPHGRKCRPLSGYDSPYCSQSCSQSSDRHRRRLKATCQTRYGVDHPSQRPEVKKRISEGHLNRKEEDIARSNKLRANTNMGRYGVRAPAQVPEIAKRMGDSQRNRSEAEKRDTVERRKKTFLETYGDENYRNTEKARTTYMRHCEEDPSFEPGIKRRIRDTLSCSYGVTCALQLAKCKKNGRIRRCSQKYRETILADEFVEPLFSEEFYVEHFNESLMWKCRKCGSKFASKVSEHQPFLARCEKCFPLLEYVSKAEKEVLDLVKRCGAETVENSRSVIPPKELDIYVPSANLAVEFDGLYWHSENQGTGSGYHLAKTLECEKRGIRLVHVFENEWIFMKPIVESRLADILGKNKCSVCVEDCSVAESSKTESAAFLRENNLYGEGIADVRIGLFERGGKLAALMTFESLGGGEWEMTRFCRRLGLSVPGAAGALLRSFESAYSPKSLACLANRRWDAPPFYEKLGFEMEGSTEPDYWYWNHRLEIKKLEGKGEAERLVGKFDESLTEAENMASAGFYRIFDCGSLVFKKTYEKAAD